MTAVALAEQGPHGDFRPAFELVESREDIGDGREAGAEDVGFARADVWFCDVAKVDHAEVDLADGGFVVVDEADDGFFVGRVDDDFFFELAAHAFAVDVVQVADFGVDRGDVAADADAALGVEAASPLPPPRWYSNRWASPLGVGPAEEAVGNELLEAGVGFHFAAGAVLDVIAFDEARPVAVDFAREALEVAEVVKEDGGDDEDSFLCDERHGKSFCVGEGECGRVSLLISSEFFERDC